MKSETLNPKSESNGQPQIQKRTSCHSDFGFRGFSGFRPSVFRFIGRLAIGCFLFSLTARAADEFGDISVSPNAIYTGNTFHGYAEIRVVLENRSPSKTHSVTLVYPNNSYGNGGNSISRLSRSVSLAPDAREVVSLLQPPLPAQGDGSIRVEVDGRHEGEVHAPNANSHCNYSYRNQMGNVFVSRSLDYDAVSHLFQAGSISFTAAKATGPPDSGSGGWDPNCWMPDTRSYGRTNWLELDYATPEIVEKISIHGGQPLPSTGFITLVGKSGTNLATIPMSSGTTGFGGGRPGGPRSRGSNWTMEFNFPETREPVKTLRLNFEKTAPSSIVIDAVAISEKGVDQWASDARASTDNSASAPAFGRGGASVDTIQSIRAESPVSEWSENWLAYSPFEAVVINEADFSAIPSSVFGALGDYIQAGGDIVLLGKTDLPAAWHPAHSKKLADGTEYDVGFGKVFTLAAENTSKLDSQTVQRLRETVRDAARYFQGLPSDSVTANSVMPVVQNLKVPTRGIVIIMLAFIVIIGPVNMIYLNRIKRRTWMLWTIPAISIATTLLVFGYSLAREGITPDTRIAGLTVLDQASHRAATIGCEAFYCPLTPSGGLHFDFGTEATPLVSIDYGSGTSREVDWTQSQHFQRGWISARVPVHFHLRKSETRRERIQVLNEGGAMQIINSLGAPIKSLWFADANMNVYQAANVAAGEKGGLILSPQPQSSGKPGVNGLLQGIGFAAHTDGLAENAGGYLQPNTYIAVLDGNPFIENALGTASSPKRTKSSAVVFGILESSEKK